MEQNYNLEEITKKLNEQIIIMNFYNQNNEKVELYKSTYPEYQIKSRIQKVIDGITAERNLYVLSKEKSFQTNREIREVMYKAEKKFERKEKASRAYLANIEATTRCN